MKLLIVILWSVLVFSMYGETNNSLEKAPEVVWVVNKDFINFVGLPKRIGKNCSFNQVNDQQESLMAMPPKNILCSYNNPLLIRGWAYDSEKNVCPPEVFIVLLSKKGDSQVFLKAQRTPRIDVADTLKNKKLVYSGFSILVPGQTIPPGNYQVQVWQSDREEIVISEVPFTIEVTDK